MLPREMSDGGRGGEGTGERQTARQQQLTCNLRKQNPCGHEATPEDEQPRSIAHARTSVHGSRLSAHARPGFTFHCRCVGRTYPARSFHRRSFTWPTP